MRKIYLLSAILAGSLLTGSATAQAASSCETMLGTFDAQLRAKSIPMTDARVAKERTKAEEACMAGNATAAQKSLDRAAARVGWTAGNAAHRGKSSGLT